MNLQLDQHFIVFPEQNGFILAKITRIYSNMYTVQCVSSNLRSMIGKKCRIPTEEMEKDWRFIPENQLDFYLKLYS